MPEKPQIIKCRLGDVDWFVVSAEFPNADVAEHVFKVVERKSRERGLVGSVGLYRHGSETRPGVVLTAVSMRSDQIAEIAPILAGATNNVLREDVIEMLIRRRIKIVLAAAEANPGKSGRLRMRHAGEGARLTPEGDLIEPGQGGDQ